VGFWLLTSSVWKSENSIRVYASTDQGKTFELRGTANVLPAEARGPDEPMIVQRKDGSLWMMVRSRGIAETFSQDGGKTWTPVKRSSLRHPTARFFLRRLKSGNLLLVKHGPLDKRVGRTDLMAFVSDDDGQTWKGGLMLDDREKVTYPDGVQAERNDLHRLRPQSHAQRRGADGDFQRRRCPRWQTRQWQDPTAWRGRATLTFNNNFTTG